MDKIPKTLGTKSEGSDNKPPARGDILRTKSQDHSKVSNETPRSFDSIVAQFREGHPNPSSKTEERKWNLAAQPDLVRDIPNEKLLGLLTKYTGEDSRGEAEKFLLERLHAKGKLTVAEGPSSGSGEERTRTKDVKVAYYQGETEVSSARREFEEAYFEFLGARDYIDKHENSFTEGSQAKETLASAWKAMGDIEGGNLEAWTSRNGDNIRFTGSYEGTRLDNNKQFEAQYKGYKEMERLLKDRGRGEETIAKKFAEDLIPNLQKKQSNYEALKKIYGEDPFVFTRQEAGREFKESLNKGKRRDEALQILGSWIKSIGKTPKGLGIIRANVVKEIDTLHG